MGKFLFRLKFLMQKRYGIDQLGCALTVLYLIVILLRFTIARSGVIGRGLGIFSWVILFYTLFRVLSSNIEGRRRENDAFLRLLGRARSANVTNPFENMSAGIGNIPKPEKDKKLVKCPNCKATLRVPRQKGKHTVRCPRCDHRFEINILVGKK